MRVNLPISLFPACNSEHGNGGWPPPEKDVSCAANLGERDIGPGIKKKPDHFLHVDCAPITRLI